MSKIYFLQGLPASGKSTWAKQKVIDDQGKTIRVNKDDLREMMFSSKWSKDKERQVLNVRDSITKQALEEGKNIIWDDTNYSNKHWLRAAEIASQYEIKMEIVSFDIPLVECLERNRKRDNSVPERIIWDMYYKYVLPKKVEQNIYDPSKKDAVIFDMDGTLAIHAERNPFEYYKCLTDEVNKPVETLLREFSEKYYILIVTGRENVHYSSGEGYMFLDVLTYTKRWLEINDIPYDDIFIRKEKDHRPDYVVKKEIFENNIKNKYNILFVVDDRKQVVDAWRELGLTCFDTAGHTF